MKWSLLFAILFSFSFVQPTLIDPGKKIIGTWKGEAENGKVILVEFTKYGDYNLIVDGTHLTAADDFVGQMKYKVLPSQDKNQFGILLFDEKTKEDYSRLFCRFY